MATVENGEILRLSVSQVEKFLGCPLQWYFEAVRGRYPKDEEASEDGTKGHALVAHYERTGEKPQGRVKMGKMVTAAINAGLFKDPTTPGLVIERRFSGQEQRDANGKWIPLDAPKTLLWAAGVPFDGAADLMYREGDLAAVVDHKFTSDINGSWTKQKGDLIKTVQMPGYGVVAKRMWPEITRFKLRHNYVSRKGEASRFVEEEVTWSQVEERWGQVENVVTTRMKPVAKATTQNDVPYNLDACEKYTGCPHQARCFAYKGKRTAMPTKADLDLFGAPAPAAQPKPAAKIVDPFGDMTPEPVKATVTPGPVLLDAKTVGGNMDPERATTVLSAPIVEGSVTSTAAVLPPDAPPDSKDVPLPEKAKRGRKPRSTIIDVKEGETEAQAEARTKAEVDGSTTVTHPTSKVSVNVKPNGDVVFNLPPEPPRKAGAVTDGPGWKDVLCSCGHNFGKRPPGSSIDAVLCPNRAAHAPAPAAVETGLLTVLTRIAVALEKLASK